jgi:hypothetical protein
VKNQETYEVANGITGQVLWTRRFKAGYILRREIWTLRNEPPTPITVAVTPHGDYIGTARNARMLCVKYGIAPEKRTPTSNVCSVGYSKRRRKWFGWSHRAIGGFKTRRQAAKFAESVS